MRLHRRRGAIRPKPLANLEAVIRRYEAAVATACKAVVSCRYDGGAVAGNAKAATVGWAALKRAGIIPSSR